MLHRYIAYNGASPTSALQAPMACGTSQKTLLQVKTPSTRGIKVTRWGITFDGVTTSDVPGVVQLAHCDSGGTSGNSLTPTILGPINVASLCVGGTGSTGYGSFTEGTISTQRVFDAIHNPPTSGYAWPFPLGREPILFPDQYLRLLVDMTAAVNAIAFIEWEE